ncbi:LLM class flavin-dependent oxidoreductase [Microbacterium album]|uniref:Nitrilotriacetate monooxygenase n=1 Tax=Microbacterium album TaxID=2053191 RepID=A0A917MLJ0_9MICO|nr:LLM class flavin-dependent oxidoreductase [Microbacterium album]GGH43001.1 nitrilotriacetate monooxygenase [Microbacterium album]
MPGTESERRLILNVNVIGVGQRPAAWRQPELHPRAIIDPAYWENVARIAERGMIDAIFIADTPVLSDPRRRPWQYLEPSTLLARVAAATTHLGMVWTASTTYNHPGELAERLLTLNTLSGGRAAWNVVTTVNPRAADNFGASLGAYRPTSDERYARAGAFLEQVLELWDRDGRGWGGDRPPRPVLVQAGGSQAGQRLAARHADVVYSVEMELEQAVRSRAAVRAFAAEAGRDPDDVAVLPGLALVIGSTEREARERFDHWESRAHPKFSLDALSFALGVDAERLDLDAPLPADVVEHEPDPATFKGSTGYRRSLIAHARKENLTVRQMLRDFGGYGQRFIAGTPERIADSIEEWFRAGAADGFNVMIDLFPSGLEDFVDHVVPILQRRGLFRTEYEERDLRSRIRGRSRALAH